MSITEPIRNKQELLDFMNYYRLEYPNPRNYALISFGLYTALRISDILPLRWKDIYYFKKQRYISHVMIREQKTGKPSLLALNHQLIDALDSYRQTRIPQPDDYIFSKRTNPLQPLSRSQAYRIIKKAANATMLDTHHISCHSLRKTFGYHAWKQGISPVLLMGVYNHSSFAITKRYLGIDQDERDALFQQLDFYKL